MKIHKYAAYFPPLVGEDFDLLVEDIKKNGQEIPIVTYNGEILDGVNRFRACEALGITPKTREYKGDDPLSYVITTNIRRRQLTDDQKAVLGLTFEELYAKEARESVNRNLPNVSTAGANQPVGRSAERAAKAVGVSKDRIKRAKRIAKEQPEKLADIASGKATIRSVEVDKDVERYRKRYEDGKKQKRKTRLDFLANDIPQVVKSHVLAAKQFREYLEWGKDGVEISLFSPEAWKYCVRLHNEIKKLLDEFEELGKNVA